MSVQNKNQIKEAEIGFVLVNVLLNLSIFAAISLSFCLCYLIFIHANDFTVLSNGAYPARKTILASP